MAEEGRLIDLRATGLDQFIAAVFDHESKDEGSSAERSPEWYWEDGLEVLWDPRRNLDLLVQLLSDPQYLLGRFTEEQIDQGFWFLAGESCPFAEAFLTGTIWNTELPTVDRQRLIELIPDLYTSLFEKLDRSRMSAPWMLWDLIAHGATLHGNQGVKEDMMDLIGSMGPDEYRQKRDTFFEWRPGVIEDHAQVRAAMLAALDRMLANPDEGTQGSALHGLNHLDHPGRRPVIQTFLDANPGLPKEAVAFAMKCADGEYM